jgi:hypothetical protein
MKKLTLDFQTLQVESFETFVAENRRGTVNARSGCYTASCTGTCGAYPDSFLEKEGINAATPICTNNGACCV